MVQFWSQDTEWSPTEIFDFEHEDEWEKKNFKKRKKKQTKNIPWILRVDNCPWLVWDWNIGLVWQQWKIIPLATESGLKTVCWNKWQIQFVNKFNLRALCSLEGYGQVGCCHHTKSLLIIVQMWSRLMGNLGISTVPNAKKTMHVLFYIVKTMSTNSVFWHADKLRN